MDELNRNSAPERREYDEYRSAAENIRFNESAGVHEYESYNESSGNSSREPSSNMDRQKKKTALSSLSTGVVAAISAAAVGITGMLNVGMDAKLKKADFQDGAVRYCVSVENMTDEETLKATLSNGDEIIFSEYLKDEDGDGIIEGTIPLDAETVNSSLNANTGTLPLHLTLSGNVGLNLERDFDRYRIDIENMESVFNSVSGKCKCTEDGCYHFKMDFKDDMHIFNDFKARIEDNFGNSSECTFTDDLHGDQTIYVSNLKGAQATLILTYLADGQPQSQKIDITL